MSLARTLQFPKLYSKVFGILLSLVVTPVALALLQVSITRLDSIVFDVDSKTN